MAAENRWDIQDLMSYLKVGESWVYKRTAPKSKLKPKLPRVQNISQLRFDPATIMALFPNQSTNSSLKIKEVGKSVLPSTPKKREKEKLW